MSMFYQRGATLITILFVLLLVTVVGTFAVKQSIVGLGIATNSQARNLMQQTADAVFLLWNRTIKTMPFYKKT